MASTADASGRHLHHHQQAYHQLQQQQQQQHQRHGPNSSGSNSGQAHSYVLYPDQPPSSRSKQQQQTPQQRSYDDLTPQSSFSSTSSSSRQNYNNSHHQQSSVVTRGDSGSSGIKTKQPQSQLSYLRTPANTGSGSSGNAPPSPISPSTPISPNNNINIKGTPIEAMTSHLSLTRLDEPVQDRVTVQPSYDQTKYQQPRKKSISAGSGQPPSQPDFQQQQQHYQPARYQQLQQEEDDSYGSSSQGGLKQSGSSGSSRSQGGSGGQGPSRTGELKQSSSSASNSSSNNYQGGPLRQSPSGGSSYSTSSTSRRERQHQPLQISYSNGSNASTSSKHQQQQQQQQQQQPTMTSSPTSPLFYLPVDNDDDSTHHRDQEVHRQQASQYHQKLQQKAPSAHGEDDSDDSDSGSMLSYTRSISRLSMSYKRTQNGAPNISLFGSGQRPAMLSNHGSSGSALGGLTGSQKMIQGQREERLRQQKLKQQQESGNGAYGSTSSLASIDQHTRQEEGRPIMVRNNHSHHGYPQPVGTIQIPERSTSADSYTGGNSSSSRSRQQGYPSSGGRSNPSSPNMAHPQNYNSGHGNSNSNNNSNNAAPRPSHESSHSQRSRPDRLKLSPNDYHQHDSNNNNNNNNNSNITMGPRSRSPGPMHSNNSNSTLPARSPGSPLPGSTASGQGSGGSGGIYRQNGYPGGMNASSSSLPLSNNHSAPRSGTPGPSGGPNGINPHPAHHLASGGYVRPEEPMGPSNPMPEKAEDFVRQGIEFHEVGDIAKATHFFRTAAELGDPVGMLMYGLSVRHGWGCASNRALAFQYLQKSAEHAVGDLKSRDSFASTAAKGELVLAIYELGICFRHGWGVEKNKKTAAYYFEIAANLGDPDAQNDLAWCYYHGVGIKKDMFKAAKYYRLAAAQGLETVGNSWIWKDKYGGVPASPTTDKAQMAF
ncbi:hypothetical protein EDD11_006671 [Mortierella claussenii]|nr:hypothetical protein EDD11_006671 [Mortierella claussenii]